MYQVQNITDDPKQLQTMILPDGSSIVMQLYFRPIQQGWFLQQLTYGDFILNEIRITNSPNMLHQFRNQLPFGLACFSTNDREPSLIEDFASEASILYVLTPAEVKAYAEYLVASG